MTEMSCRTAAASASSTSRPRFWASILAIWQQPEECFISQTRELLPGWGFPSDKLDRVADAIRTHQSNDEPVALEGVILRDADILEQLGSIGALRALVKVGRDTRYPTFTAVMPVLRKAVDELPGKLRLDSAKRLAVARVETLRSLIAAIEEEAAGALY